MKIKDSVGKYLSYSEGDYYDDVNSMDYDYDDEQEDEYEEDEPVKSKRASGSKKSFFDTLRDKTSKITTKRKSEPEYDNEYDEDEEEYEDEEPYYEEPQPRRASSGNVVDFNSKPRSGNAKVILAKPSLFDPETAKDIARHVNKKRLVLLNLEMVSDSDVRRMIDFLSGVVFANNGKISSVANKTFIILPHEYDFTGDMLEGLKNGYYGI